MVTSSKKKVNFNLMGLKVELIQRICISIETSWIGKGGKAGDFFLLLREPL